MWGLLLTLSLAASAGEMAAVGEATTPALGAVAVSPRPDRLTLSCAPLATLLAGLASMTNEGRFLYAWLPVGVSVPMSDRSSLDFELGLALIRNVPWQRFGWSVSLAGGTTWYFGAAPRTGFFIGPRAMVQVARTAGSALTHFNPSPTSVVTPGTSPAFLVGCQLGYLFRIGRVVLGPVLGASAGFAFNSQNGPVATPFGVRDEPAPSDMSVFALDLNLFRLGVVF